MGNRTDMSIGIISDTHGLLRTEVLRQLQGCDAILHAGDVGSREVLQALGEIAPTQAVRGNVDRDELAVLPLSLDVTLGGLRFAVAHRKSDLPEDLAKYDIVVYGHTHQWTQQWLDHSGGGRTLLLNPGSCGPRRFHLPVTMAMLHISGDGWTARRIDLLRPQREPEPALRPTDMRSLIEQVIRETDRGKPVEAIARKYGADPALAEQIARLYLTHPGVTVEGIMAKMGL